MDSFLVKSIADGFDLEELVVASNQEQAYVMQKNALRGLVVNGSIDKFEIVSVEKKSNLERKRLYPKDEHMP